MRPDALPKIWSDKAVLVFYQIQSGGEPRLVGKISVYEG